ncbi:MAG: hypothetical protein ACFB4I_23155 [Cyanophyceae cyanobacterium]
MFSPILNTLEPKRFARQKPLSRELTSIQAIALEQEPNLSISRRYQILSPAMLLYTQERFDVK